MKLCQENSIKQSFTRPKTPRTNGKAERVIKTIQEMWLAKTRFKNRFHRRQGTHQIRQLLQHGQASQGN